MIHKSDKLSDTQISKNFESDLSEKQNQFLHDSSNPQSPSKCTLASKKSLSNLLLCTKCLNTYNNQEFLPKVLICGHTICSPCLFSLSSIICPFCQHADKRDPTKIPENIYLRELIEDYDRKIIENYDHKNYCKEHSKEIGIYCENDEKFLCFDCIIKHKGHDFLPLTDQKLFEMAETNRKFIQDAKNECKNNIENGEKAIKAIEEEDLKIEKLVEGHVQNYNEMKNDFIVAIMKATSYCTGTIENYLDIHVKNQKEVGSLKFFVEISSKSLQDVEKIEKEYENKTIVDKVAWNRNEIEKVPDIPSIKLNNEIVRELEKPRDYRSDVFEIFKKLINVI
ncbi:unnamed protein product [Blepharisma stoltei]|uniref:RING-type domain-containing protein n=1 Tax=Blepharisma stoltei TaxID=1481888 RepID=A0AAU9KEG5_9CILI|nr:unnamed protein product [Blepharisma stoltei]